jgi:hydrogenase maturation protease HycI
MIQNLKAILKTSLKKAERIAVLGIGSELRSDDAAGLIAAEELEKIKNPKLKVFFGSTAPENLTGEIITYKPTHIIIIDSVDTDCKPGFILLIKPEDAGGVSFSSHMLPIKMMVDYMIESLGCDIIIIGIQPKSLIFGGNISNEVKKSAIKISTIIKEIIL